MFGVRLAVNVNTDYRPVLTESLGLVEIVIGCMSLGVNILSGCQNLFNDNQGRFYDVEQLNLSQHLVVSGVSKVLPTAIIVGTVYKFVKMVV